MYARFVHPIELNGTRQLAKDGDEKLTGILAAGVTDDPDYVLEDGDVCIKSIRAYKRHLVIEVVSGEEWWQTMVPYANVACWYP